MDTSVFIAAESGRGVDASLWIAAVALAHDLPVLTQTGDYEVLAAMGGPETIRI